MLNNAGLENSERSGTARTTTFMPNITEIKGKDKCPYQLLFGSKHKLPTKLKMLGEMDTATTKADIQGKLKNQRITCIFVGYSVDHSNDVY
jgi:hypothetical protein